MILNTLMIESRNGYREISLEEAKNFVGPGWSSIIERVIDELFENGWDGKISQIKEKYGSLRFYFEQNYNDDIFNIVFEAETQSRITCELCGEYGILHISNERLYLKTLCEGCASSNNYRKYEVDSI